jgi:hypothetical protein
MTLGRILIDNKQYTKASKRSVQYIKIMLHDLPYECKQLIWNYFDLKELCRAPSVCHQMTQGVNLTQAWRARTIEFIVKEYFHPKKFIRILTRTNAMRNLKEERTLPVNKEPQEESIISLGDNQNDKHNWYFWFKTYRDFYLSIKRFSEANRAFEAATNKIQALKWSKNELKLLLQSTKQSQNRKHSHEKQMRRMQMNCIKWMNRSHRRLTASQHSQSSISKSFVDTMTQGKPQEELKSIENELQLQTTQLFHLRAQSQRTYQQYQNQLKKVKVLSETLGRITIIQ